MCCCERVQLVRECATDAWKCMQWQRMQWHTSSWRATGWQRRRSAAAIFLCSPTPVASWVTCRLQLVMLVLTNAVIGSKIRVQT